jgi:hypothetical protein
MHSTDNNGLIIGGLKTALGLAAINLNPYFLLRGQRCCYGYYSVNQKALMSIAAIVENGQVIYIL